MITVTVMLTDRLIAVKCKMSKQLYILDQISAVPVIPNILVKEREK